MLKAARARQMDQKEHFLAVQAQRERAEFERVLRYAGLGKSVFFVMLKCTGTPNESILGEGEGAGGLGVLSE